MTYRRSQFCRLTQTLRTTWGAWQCNSGIAQQTDEPLAGTAQSGRMGLPCSPCHIACQAEGENHDWGRQQPPSGVQMRSCGLKEQPAQFDITFTPTACLLPCELLMPRGRSIVTDCALTQAAKDWQSPVMVHLVCMWCGVVWRGVKPYSCYQKGSP